ncbi:uncharacterized protein [Miscanthus floridulus]|uniref:uncharacterized protein n=1 Tax=Miscanthus floridulus TaxID=154761 RepID=UPI003459429B
MSEDYRRNNQSTFMVEQMVLMDIRKLLQSMQKDIKMYPLPDIDDTYDASHDIPREIFEEASIEANEDDVALSDTLHKEQRAAYDEIMSSIDTKDGGLFFVDGPSRTRKTYLYRALLATIRSQKKIAVATTTSGVAASIMPGGRTADSRFKIPLTIDNGAFCTFTKQSGTAKLLRVASLIIWDEVTMIKRQGVEALDNNLRDIMDRPELPFGGEDRGVRWRFQTGSSHCLERVKGSDEMFPSQFKRKQFLIRLSFTMTVNKAQGQTIPNVGVYLPEPVFSHGQLYVALSRATARSNIRILAVPAGEKDVNKRKGKGKGKKRPTKDIFTKNIVYKEILTL